MKHLFFVFILLNAVRLSAQPEPLPQDPFTMPNFADSTAKANLETKHLAFFTKELALTDIEIKNFWHVFKDFQATLRSVRPSNVPKKDVENMSENEVTNMVLTELDKQAQEVAIRKKYFKKMKRVISPKKIIKLHRIERDFRQSVLKELNKTN